MFVILGIIPIGPHNLYCGDRLLRGIYSTLFMRLCWCSKLEFRYQYCIQLPRLLTKQVNLHMITIGTQEGGYTKGEYLPNIDPI